MLELLSAWSTLKYKVCQQINLAVDSDAFDSENVVAHLHESEQVNLGWNDSFLRLCEVELWVSECL